VPHPPLRCEGRRSPHKLVLDDSCETTSERPVLGGLKSKNVDVVVAKEGVGPVLCVSVKGTGKAFRNLTNRMEEAIGDCTNLHIMYPGLVYGFLSLLKANRGGQQEMQRNDVAIDARGNVENSIVRYHNALAALAGRKTVRNDGSRYEAIALVLVESRQNIAGQIYAGFPGTDSPLLLAHLFEALYNRYDQRYPYTADTIPALRRAEWEPNSPALEDIQNITGKGLEEALGYTPRLA